jgi:hypothetical protein
MNPERKVEVPSNAPRGLCKGAGCLKPIRWVRTPRGNRMPVDPDGTPHWATCPDSPSFRKREQQQARLREIREKGW